MSSDIETLMPAHESAEELQWLVPSSAALPGRNSAEKELPQGPLATMPVEMLLLIATELPAEDYLCLVQTCRRLRRIGHENSHGPGLASLVTPDASRPYRGFRVLNLLQGEGQRSMDGPPSLGSPVYDLAAPQNTQARRLARRLQKDQLCRSCWDFRRDAGFVAQLRALLRPMHCSGCARPHASLFFPPAQRLGRQLGLAAPSLCVGRLGTVRPCAHVRWTWDAFVHMRAGGGGPPAYACALCDTFAPRAGDGSGEGAVGAPGRRSATTHLAAHGAEHLLTLCGRYSAPAGEEALRQACVRKEGYYPCPHWRLGDGRLLAAVVRAYRDCQRDRSLGVTALVDASHRRLRCAICGASFELQRAVHRGATAYSVHVRRLMRWNVRPDLDDWLDHLDPRSFRDMWHQSPDTYRITWCHDPTCLTSRGRRKEAVLYSLARWAEDPDPDLWESARRRALFLEWFVTAIGDEDEQFSARKEETDRLCSLSRGTAAERASAEEEALSYVP